MYAILDHYLKCEEFRQMVKNAKTLLDMYDIEEYLLNNGIRYNTDKIQDELLRSSREHFFDGHYKRLEIKKELHDLYKQDWERKKKLFSNDRNNELFG